ncbi:hypothetical protein PG990_003328 [Apiospora arundinis]
MPRDLASRLRVPLTLSYNASARSRGKADKNVRCHSHLLGKKSWNVYNTTNIERVRADEEAARAREEAEEQKQQEQDAERRLAILRGEEPPPLPPAATAIDPSSGRLPRRDDDNDREQWRMGGGESASASALAKTTRTLRCGSRSHGPKELLRQDELTPSSLIVKHKSSDAPLTDAAGHIDLFAAPADDKIKEAKKKAAEKNPEAEAEAARKQRSFEDQYTMRFSNAAGFRTELSKTASGPWYATAGTTSQRGGEPVAVVGKDVWGNEDPGRPVREAARIVSSDPLAAMKRGAAQVRQVEQERRAANAERDKQSRQLRREEDERRRERKRHHSRHRDDGDDSANLDTTRAESRRSEHRHRHRHRDVAGSERSRDRHSKRDDHDAERSHSRRHHRHDSGEDRERRHHSSSHHDEKRQKRSDDERVEIRQHRESRR